MFKCERKNYCGYHLNEIEEDNCLEEKHIQEDVEEKQEEKENKKIKK